MTRQLCLIVLFAIGLCSSASAADNPYLYKVTLVQAAPGKLLELIDLYKQQTAALKDVDEAPLWMRHSQGDHWDLMILFPMEKYAGYYQPQRSGKRAERTASLGSKFKEDIA